MIRRALFTAATAAALLAAGTGIAAASPNQQHPDITTPAPYCGPGAELVGAHCETIRYLDGSGPRAQTTAGLGTALVAALGAIALF